MFTKEGGAVHGDQGAFLPRTLSQWSDPAAQDISAEEDKMGDRIEEYRCVQASSIMLGDQRAFCLLDHFPNGGWISYTFKDDVCIKLGFCNQVPKACHLNNKHFPPTVWYLDIGAQCMNRFWCLGIRARYTNRFLPFAASFLGCHTACSQIIIPVCVSLSYLIFNEHQ